MVQFISLTNELNTTMNENNPTTTNFKETIFEKNQPKYTGGTNPLIDFLKPIFNQELPPSFGEYQGVHQFYKYINTIETYEYLKATLGNDEGIKFISMLNDGNTYEYFTHKNLVKDLWKISQIFYDKSSEKDTNSVLKILEPSAGIGNLLRYIPQEVKNHYQTIYNKSEFSTDQNFKTFETYAYELNPINTFILKKTLPNTHLLGDDFLNNDLKDEQFDMVMANPPFSMENYYSDEIDKDNLSNHIIFESLRKLKVNGHMIMIIDQKFVNTLKRIHSKIGPKSLFEYHLINSVYVNGIVEIPKQFFNDILTQTYIVILEKKRPILSKTDLLQEILKEKEKKPSDNKFINTSKVDVQSNYQYSKLKEFSTPYGKNVLLSTFYNGSTIDNYKLFLSQYSFHKFTFAKPFSNPNLPIIHNEKDVKLVKKDSLSDSEQTFIKQLDEGFNIYKSILLLDNSNHNYHNNFLLNKEELKSYIVNILGLYDNLSAKMRKIADNHIFGEIYQKLSEFDMFDDFANKDILNNSLQVYQDPIDFIKNNLYLLYTHYSQKEQRIDKIINKMSITSNTPTQEIVEYLTQSNIIFKDEQGVYKDCLRDNIFKKIISKYIYQKQLTDEEQTFIDKINECNGVIETKISEQSLIINSQVFNNLNTQYIFKLFLSTNFDFNYYRFDKFKFKAKFKSKVLNELSLYSDSMKELLQIGNIKEINTVFNKITQNRSLTCYEDETQTKINENIANRIQQQFKEFLIEFEKEDTKFINNPFYKQAKESANDILVQNTLAQYQNIFTNQLIKDIKMDLIPFQNKDIKLRQHQVSAIATILNQPATLLAHAVGAGKTYEMIFSFEAMRALNQAKRALFIMPKSLLKPFQAEYKKSFPLTKIITLSSQELNQKNIQKTYLKIIQNNFQSIIVTYEGYENMSSEFIDLAIEEIQSKLIHTTGKYSKKNIQKTLKDLLKEKNKIDKQNRINPFKRVLSFNDLNIDALYLDESHYYKNRVPADAPSDIKGASGSNVKKAEKNYLLTLNMLKKGKKVIWATGTYVSNSINELYVIQETLAPETLQNLTYKEWLNKFAIVENVTEFAPSGTGFVNVKKITKFKNLPYLLNQLNSFINYAGAKSLDLDLPTAHYHIIDIEANELQKNEMKDLSDRAKAIKNKEVEPFEDNYLKLTSDGKKIGLSLKLLNEKYQPKDTQKPAEVAKNVAKIYHETVDERLTQAIFLDLGTSKNNSDKFNVYEYIKSMLIELGVREDEIVFANDRDKLKGAAYDKFYETINNGDKRIIFASTSKGGVGANYQKKLKAIHHVDILWKPSDLIQREGRIVRQGNENKNVDIYVYLTKDTFDTNLWQKVSGKQTVLSQIYEGVPATNEGEDFSGNEALNYEEILQATVSDPSIKRIFELKKEIYNMELIKETSALQDKRKKDRINKLSNSIKNIKSTINKDIRILKIIQNSSGGIKFYNTNQEERAKQLYLTIKNQFTNAKFIHTIFSDMFNVFNKDLTRNQNKPILNEKIFSLNGIDFVYNGEVTINSELFVFTSYNFKVMIDDKIISSWTYNPENYKRSSAQLYNFTNISLKTAQINDNINDAKKLVSEYQTLLKNNENVYDENRYQGIVQELNQLESQQRTA